LEYGQEMTRQFTGTGLKDQLAVDDCQASSTAVVVVVSIEF